MTGLFGSGTTTSDANWIVLSSTYSDGVVATTRDGAGVFVSAHAVNLTSLTPAGAGYTYAYAGGIDTVNFDSIGNVTGYVSTLSASGMTAVISNGADWQTLSMSYTDTGGTSYSVDAVTQSVNWTLAATSVLGAYSGVCQGGVTVTNLTDPLGLFVGVGGSLTQTTTAAGTTTGAVDHVAPSGSYFDVWWQFGNNGGYMGTSEYNASSGAYYASWVDMSMGTVTSGSVSGVSTTGSVDAVAMLHHPDMVALATGTGTGGTPPGGGTDTISPTVMDAWADGAGTFGVMFSESIMLNNQSLAGVTAYKNGATQMMLTGAAINAAFPTELAMTYSDSLVAGDFIVLAYDAVAAGNNISDLSSNATSSGVLVTSVGMGGVTVGATVDMSQAPLPTGITSVFMRGNAGVDNFTGTNGGDTIITGRGADIITGGLGQDIIDLNESTRATDTVVINAGDSTPVGGASDLVYGFDVMSGANNDMLDLPSNIIAANTTGVTGAAYQTILSHSITNGMISFDDASIFTSALVIGDTTNWGQVKNYMMANIADGQTVATYIDMNGDNLYTGGADRLAVFQGNATMDIQVQLYDTMSMVTALSNMANVNSVTII